MSVASPHVSCAHYISVEGVPCQGVAAQGSGTTARPGRIGAPLAGLGVASAQEVRMIMWPDSEPMIGMRREMP